MTLAHHLESGGFQNPWPPKATRFESLATILRISLSKAQSFEIPVEPAKTVHELEGSDFTSATWLRHAGFYIELPRYNAPQLTRIVFDPIFADRASPSTWVGPRQYFPTPCAITDLPGVDFVVISHNHYDHLDVECLRHIHARWPDVHFLVPLGVKRTITDEIGVENRKIQEMDWWDRVLFPVVNAAIEFVCTPAQHNSGRGIFDQSKSLWASWVVRQLPSPESPPVTSIYFAGDTGYSTASGPCPAFKEIGDRYGPFHLAMIPIWRGASLSILGRLGFRLNPDANKTLLSTLHTSPSDAVDLAMDVKAMRSIAMHYGTFCGSEDEAMEPLVLLRLLTNLCY